MVLGTSDGVHDINGVELSFNMLPCWSRERLVIAMYVLRRKGEGDGEGEGARPNRVSRWKLRSEFSMHDLEEDQSRTEYRVRLVQTSPRP